MRQSRRNDLIVTAVTAGTLGLLALTLASLMTSQTLPAADVEVEGTVRICHIADFHAAVERRADKVGKQFYTRCANSKFALSKVTAIKHILNENCDLKFFTGDLMHGGDYDLLENDASILAGTGSSSDEYGISAQLMPYWGIDAWSPGNHELSDGNTMKALVGKEQPPMICSNLKSMIGKVLPYKKFVIKTPIMATICVFGVVRPEMVNASPDLYQASDPLTSLEVAFNESLKDGCGEPGTLTILLSHSGWDYDMQLIQKIQASPRAPRINIVLGGHTHNLIPDNYPWMVNETALSHVGAFGGWVGSISIRSTTNGNNRKMKYIPPWSSDKPKNRPTNFWSLSTEGSKRISSRYKIVKQESANTRKLETQILESHASIPDEPEHGYTLRALKPPGKSVSNIQDFIQVGYNVFKNLCGQDQSLLGGARDKLKQIIGNLTKQVVSDIPRDFHEKSIECRRGQCAIGKWLSQVIMLTPTATVRIAIHCPAASVPVDNRGILSSTDEPASLETVHTVIGAIQAGVIRSSVPQECDSHFEYLAGGCQLRSPSTQLDLYDVERLLPFHNQLRLIVVKDLDAICDMLQQSVLGWLADNGSSPGVTHFGNLHYFANAKHYGSTNAQKGRQPFFDELWSLSDAEALGVEIRNLQGKKHRGVCWDNKAGGLSWNCVTAGCDVDIGRVLVIAPELLVKGADNAIIKWHKHADKDFLRSVATKIVQDDTSLGCWLDGLKDFTVNDAAALFLNASVSL